MVDILNKQHLEYSLILLLGNTGSFIMKPTWVDCKELKEMLHNLEDML